MQRLDSCYLQQETTWLRRILRFQIIVDQAFIKKGTTREKLL